MAPISVGLKRLQSRGFCLKPDAFRDCDLFVFCTGSGALAVGAGGLYIVEAPIVARREMYTSCKQILFCSYTARRNRKSRADVKVFYEL